MLAMPEYTHFGLPECPGCTCCERAATVADEPCEAKVTELGFQGRVQHDIAWLDIPVHDRLLRILVQVHQRGAKAEGDLVPDCPWQQVVWLVQVSIETAVGYQFIDKQEIAFVTTIKPSKELKNF
jgi:hypothetical protein